MRVHDLFIKQLGPKGDGVHVGREGRCYVDRTVTGDRVLARVVIDELGVPRGEVKQILVPSPHRQAPPCPHYDRCGNCTVQHVRDDYYRTWKEKLVADALKKEKLTPAKKLETVFLGDRNRRRATFASIMSYDEMAMGYYRRRTQEIYDIDTCLVADRRVLEIREAVWQFLPRILIEEQVVDIFIQIVGDVADVVMTGPVGRDGYPDDNVGAALEELMQAAPIARVSWRASEGDRPEVLLETGPLVVKFGGIEVDLPPAAFLQPTPEGERALVDAVMAALPESGHFADLFSGCGTFTGPMLARGPVDAYESIAAAVEALSEARGAANTLEVTRRDLFTHPLHPKELNGYDVVVFDPPRGGCPEQAEAMAASKTPRLIGVSCNPTTFARDARILVEGGYTFESLQIIDQFKWSHHVEVVGVFSRQ